ERVGEAFEAVEPAGEATERPKAGRCALRPAAAAVERRRERPRSRQEYRAVRVGRSVVLEDRRQPRRAGTDEGGDVEAGAPAPDAEAGRRRARGRIDLALRGAVERAGILDQAERQPARRRWQLAFAPRGFERGKGLQLRRHRGREPELQPLARRVAL